jgi:hypothetical protein
MKKPNLFIKRLFMTIGKNRNPIKYQVMRARIPLALLTLCLTLNCAYAEPAPNFGDYHVPVQVKHGAPPLMLTDAQSRQYRTAIREAAKGTVNFAGHYIFATWGCGAGCVMAAAIDTVTGRVSSLPFTVSDWPLDVTEPLSWRADSRLLIVLGSRNESRQRQTYDYVFNGKTFALRATGPLKP